MTKGTKAPAPDRLLALPGEPTLDEVIRRLPTRLTDAELDAVIEHDRMERAAWLTKEEKKAAKKAAKAEAQDGE